MFQIATENVTLGLLRISPNVRAEVVKVRVSDEDIQPVKIPLIVRGVHDSRRIVVIVKDQ